MIISITSDDLMISVVVSENGEPLPFPESLLAAALKAIKCVTDEQSMIRAYFHYDPVGTTIREDCDPIWKAYKLHHLDASRHLHIEEEENYV